MELRQIEQQQAPRVTEADVNAVISAEYWFTAASALGKDVPLMPGLEHITICILVLKNGMKIVGVNEGPVSPENYDAEIGIKMAREKARDQIWPLLGYELRTHLKAAEEEQAILERIQG